MNVVSKLFFTLAVACSCVGTVTATQTSEPKRERRFEISKHPGYFSTEFYIDEEYARDSVIVRGMRHPLNPWICYYLYDGMGELTGVAYKKWVNTGIFFTRMSEFDILDAQGEPVGMIDGQWLTSANAKFSIYQYRATDNTCPRVGIAYLDSDNMKYTIYHPENERRVIATFLRKIVADARDYWEVQIIDDTQIDERIIRAFAAFAVDTQSYFKADDVDLPKAPSKA